jgi:ATPase subunit of ABC transporter with duplicated ATPase domains
MKQREFHSALTRGEIILSAKNVSKVYGSTHALKGVNFDIRRGEVTTLFGENGAGKSTLMKILSGVITREQRRDPAEWRGEGVQLRYRCPQPGDLDNPPGIEPRAEHERARQHLYWP